MRELTPEQRRAVERRDGSLLVRAGAGTGKTTVLVERFVQAVLEDGAEVDQVLAITFTEKAAAEMKSRVRKRFLDLGRREDARAAESAWVSTIHGLCARMLRAHALSAGIDPAFRVLDEVEADRIATDAFDGALEEFMGEDPDRIEMVAAYTPDRLRDMVRTAYSHLRSRGQRRPRLEETRPPVPAGEADRLEDAARAALAELGVAAGGKSVEKAIAAIEERAPLPGGNAKALCTAACDEYREAHAAHTAVEVATREHRDHTMLRVLLELYGDRYERRKRDRAALDFEDLELVARDLLAGDEGLREAYSSRFEHVLVDEFQDTNRLQNELLALLSRDNLFRVGDENQSIYRFRNADVSVFREHWEEAQRGRPGGEHHRELPRPRRDPRRHRPRVRAHLGRVLRAAARGAGLARGGGSGRAVRRAARRRARPRRLEGAHRRRRLLRRVAPRSAGVARRGGAPPRQADRRAHARGTVVLRRRGDPVPRHDRDGPVRARAGRARDTRARGGRARLLGPAAGGRPPPLARGAGEPAGRSGAVLGAGVAARRAVAGRGGVDRAARAPRPLGPVAHRAGRPTAATRRTAMGRTPRARSSRRCPTRIARGSPSSSSASRASAGSPGRSRSRR